MNDHPVSSTTTYNEHENNDSMTTTISQQQQHQSNPDVVTNHDHRHHVSIYQLQQSSKELCRVALDAFVSTVQQILQSAKDDDERRQYVPVMHIPICIGTSCMCGDCNMHADCLNWPSSRPVGETRHGKCSWNSLWCSNKFIRTERKRYPCLFWERKLVLPDMR